MAIRDDILTLKNKEGTLANNKVCNFAYDDTAFEDDTTTGANGVITYNYNNHNNIPVKDPTVLKVNPTIISKGFRSQVSTLPRMLLNHIFGRVSYNLNKTVDTFNSFLSNLYNYIGQPNGLATLDNTGRLPYSQLPLSAVEYKGAWNASTNTPTLASGSGTFGDEYIVSTQGTQNLGEGSITYRVGDRVIYNGSIWQRIPSSSVRTVNTKAPNANGNVTINAEDIVTPDVYGYDRRDSGKTWEQTPNFTTDGFDIIKHANEVWVATGLNGGLYYSINGNTWYKSPTSSIDQIYFTDIMFANGIWVAGGTGNWLWWSENGISWTQCSIPSGVYISITKGAKFCFYNGKWNVIFTGSNSDDTVYYSTDGKTWIAGTAYIYGKSIAVNNTGRWVIASSTLGLFYSDDGETYTRTPDTVIQSMSFRSVYFADGLWIAINFDSVEYWSTNGINWTQGNSNVHLDLFLFVNGLWVGGSTNGYGLYWSNDGKNWNSAISGVGIIRSLEYNDGLWLACTSFRGVMWSSDGKNWQVSLTPAIRTTDCYSVAYYNHKYVMGTASTGIWVSLGTLSNNVSAILDWLLYAVDNLLE